MAEETTFYNSGDVAVTNARFIVGSQTFAMRGITSVQGVETPVSYIGPVLFGLLALFMCYGVFGGNYFLGVVGILLLAADVLIIIGRRPKFAVVLRTAGGEVTAYESTKRDDIAPIIQALNQAMISQG